MSSCRALRGAVEKQCGVSVRVGRVWREVEEGRREVVKLKRERHETQRHCRELTTQIQASRKFTHPPFSAKL